MKGSKLERKDYKFGRKHSNIGRNDSKSEKKICTLVGRNQPQKKALGGRIKLPKDSNFRIYDASFGRKVLNLEEKK